MAGIDDYTVLLLHCDGDLLDSSGRGNDCAAYSGTVEYSSDPAKFGQSVYPKPGTIRGVFSSTDLNFGTGAFTIDYWNHVTDGAGTGRVYTITQNGMALYEYAGTATAIINGTSHSGVWTRPNGAWHHSAWAREADGTCHFLADGTHVFSWVNAGNISGTYAWSFCTSDGTTNPIDYYVDEIRVSKGVARWTENFTPPDAPYSPTHVTAGMSAPADISALRYFEASGETNTAVIRQNEIWDRRDNAGNRNGGIDQSGIYLAGNRTAAVESSGVKIAAGRNAASEAQAESYTRSGWEIWLDGTKTGFIDRDDSPAAINCGTLADGTHEMEVRPAEFFWPAGDPGVRTSKRYWFEVSGGTTAATLPPIENLRSQRVGGVTYLRWTLPDGYGAEAVYDFGLWAGTASPVDTSGTAAQTKRAYDGAGAYNMSYSQSGAYWIAMSARDSSGSMGPVSELELPWSGTFAAPENLLIQEA
jgi:hypothetical protein